MSRKLVFTSLALASPAAAQDAEFTQLAERATAGTPPPSKAEMTAGALGALKRRAADAKTCLPTAVAMQAPRSAAADRQVSDLIRAGKVKNGWTA